MSCPLCGGEGGEEMADLARVLRVREGHRILCCVPCGLARLEPRFTEAELAEIYGPGYIDEYRDSGGGIPGGDARLPAHLMARIQALGPPSRLLEIGCSRGLFLDEARRHGWTVAGVEFDRAAAGHAREHLGLDVRVGRLEEVDLEAGAWDVVHMNHVLEHFVDPVAALRRLGPALHPGGRLVVEVPNEYDTLFYRLGRLLFPLSRRVVPVPSPHQVFFTAASLRRTIEAAGFRVVRVRTLRYSFGRPGEGIAMRLAKRAVYWLERPLRKAAMVEAWACVIR